MKLQGTGLDQRGAEAAKSLACGPHGKAGPLSSLPALGFCPSRDGSLVSQALDADERVRALSKGGVLPTRTLLARQPSLPHHLLN